MIRLANCILTIFILSTFNSPCLADETDKTIHKGRNSAHSSSDLNVKSSPVVDISGMIQPQSNISAKVNDMKDSRGEGFKLSIVIFIIAIFSFSTTIVIVRLLSSHLAKKNKKNIQVVETLTESQEKIESVTWETKSSAVNIDKPVIKDVIEHALSSVRAERYVPQTKENLSEIARKLGVGRGELDLKIHLREVQSTQSVKEMAA